MSRARSLSVAALTFVACARSSGRPPPVTPLRAPSTGAVAIIRSLSDEAGPRLAGSPGDARAVVWGLRTMRELGLSNVRSEPVTVPHWDRGAESGAIVSPFAHRVALAALGGSVGTPADGIEAEVVEVDSLDALEALAADRVAGRIVFVNRAMPRFPDGHGYGQTVPVRGRAASRAARKGAAAVLVRSIGTDDTRFPHTGALRYEDNVPRIPAAALSVADAETLHRIVARGGPVRFRLALGCQTLPDAQSANVVGELPGAERPDEVVLAGAHLDSWDLGTGAIDDGAGIAIVLRSAVGVARLGRHRRTLRVVLFANEENGLAGARAYAATHQGELSNHVAALEADAGDGRATSLAFTGGPEGRAVYQRLLSAVRRWGVVADTDDAHGGADISPLIPAGVPRLDIGQDMSRYFDNHHTANDTPSIVDEAALDHAVAVWTAVLRELLTAPEPLGRAPVPARH